MDTSQRLREAIRHNKLATVSLILERYPRLIENRDLSNGWTNLHYAAYHGHYQICVELITRGHDKKEVSLSIDRCTPLHLAALKNREQALHYLAQHIQRSIDWQNIRGHTALYVAAECGNDPCVNILADFGAQLDIGDLRGTRPLHVAAAYGYVKVLRTLVDRGADGMTPNDEGWSPSDFGSTKEVQQYLRTLLADHGPSKQVNSATPSTPPR